MITDNALADAVLDEAEAIVRAEWMRLQHHHAVGEYERSAGGCEMLAVRPRALDGATPTSTVERAEAPPARRRDGWTLGRGPRRKVRPTQRSPPRPEGRDQHCSAKEAMH
jgi:hypothetical protein